MKHQDDPNIREALWACVPERSEIEPDWTGVLEREPSAALKRVSRRALIVAFAVAGALALAGSTYAVGSEMGWWPADEMPIDYPDETMRMESLDGSDVVIWSGKPASDVAVVSTGEWEGRDWFVFIYRSVGNKLEPEGQACFGIATGTPGSPVSEAPFPIGGANCIQIPNLDPELASSARLTTPLTYSFTGGYTSEYLSRLPEEFWGPLGKAESDFPSFAYGPVTDKAERVVFELMNGEKIGTKAMALPEALGLPMRFFVVELPTDSDILYARAFSAEGIRVSQSSDVYSYEDSPRPACLQSATCTPEELEEWRDPDWEDPRKKCMRDGTCPTPNEWSDSYIPPAP